LSSRRGVFLHNSRDLLLVGKIASLGRGNPFPYLIDLPTLQRQVILDGLVDEIIAGALCTLREPVENLQCLVFQFESHGSRHGNSAGNVSSVNLST